MGEANFFAVNFILLVIVTSLFTCLLAQTLYIIYSLYFPVFIVLF